MVGVSYLVHYDTSLQSATDIIANCDSCFVAIWDKGTLQNSSGTLLQNVTVLLQYASVHTT